MPVHSTWITFNNLSIILDPRNLLAEFERLNLDPSKFVDRANSFSLPRGKWPGRGYFLMLKKDYDALDLTSYHTVKFNAPPHNVEVQRLIIVSAESILGGSQPETDNDVLLVEVSDARVMAMMSCVRKSFNVLAPDYQSYLLNSTDEGTTWPEIADYLYNQLPSVFTSFEVADANSHGGNVEGWHFQGISAWDALCHVSDHLDNVIYCTRLGKLVMVDASNAGNGYIAYANDSRERLLYHGRNRENNLVSIPETIRVLFPKRDHAFQNSADPLDVTFNVYWNTRPLYAVDVLTSTILPDQYTAAGTVTLLHDSLEAYYNQVGVLQNSAALNSQAADRAEAYLNALDVADQSTHQIYMGAVDFSPGSKVAIVSWFDTGDGIKTELILSSRKKFTPPGLVTPSRFSSNLAHLKDWPELIASEYPNAPDIGREHKPYEHWAVVTLTEPLEPFSVSNDALVKYGNGNLFYDTAKEIDVVDILGGYYETGSTVVVQYHGQARIWIVVSPPVCQPLLRFELYTDLELGGIATAKLVIWNGAAYVTTGAAFPIQDFTEEPGSWKGKAGYRGWCVYKTDSEYFEIVWMETQARYIEFTLEEPLEGGQASASVDAWWDIKEPDSPQIVYDRQGLWEANCPEGAQGLAVYDETADEYVIVRIETYANWIYFKLHDEYSPSPDIFKVEVISFWQGLDPSDDDGLVDVTDRGAFFPDAKKNNYTTTAEGFACYDPELQLYVIVQLQQAAPMLRCTLNDPITSATITVQCTVVSVISRSLNIQKPAVTITVHNVIGFDGDDNAICYVVWNYDLGQWELLQVQCPA